MRRFLVLEVFFASLLVPLLISMGSARSKEVPLYQQVKPWPELRLLPTGTEIYVPEEEDDLEDDSFGACCTVNGGEDTIQCAACWEEASDEVEEECREEVEKICHLFCPLESSFASLIPSGGEGFHPPDDDEGSGDDDESDLECLVDCLANNFPQCDGQLGKKGERIDEKCYKAPSSDDDCIADS